MEELKRLMYSILHIIKCPDEDLIEEYGGSRVRCRKCGRTMYVFRK